MQRSSSRLPSRTPAVPRRISKIGISKRNANVVLVWERISGSIGCSTVLPSEILPVKIARPNTAVEAHENVASAMKMYPRRLPWVGDWGRAVAALLTEEFFDTIRVKADQDLVSDH
jgi:hypothetical protein